MSKQFNIKGQNGLYLSNEVNTTLTALNYKSLLIQDYDFFPQSSKDANLFDLKNVKYDQTLNQFYGSNSISKSNSALTYSYAFKTGDIIPNKKYYNTFKMYFKFTGSSLGGFTFPGFSGTSSVTLSAKVLNALRLKVYIQLGSNLIPATLSNLTKVTASGGSTFVAVTNSDISGGSGNISQADGTKTGIQLTTGLNSESCIDMRYTTGLSGLFTNIGLNGYSFCMDVSLPDFDQIALKTKDYKIIVKYYNIGVTGTGVPTTFTTSESVELMSNNYIYYERISVPTYSSASGGGGVSGVILSSSHTTGGAS